MKRFLVAYLLCIWVSTVHAVTYKSETVNGGRTLRTYTDSTLFSYACGNYSECSLTWGEKYAGTGYHAPASCKQDGDNVKHDDKSWWCCISGGTSSNYGEWKESATWEITQTETKYVNGTECIYTTITDVCNRLISTDMQCGTDLTNNTKSASDSSSSHGCSDNQFWNSVKQECVDKSTYTAISKTDMEKCFACRTNSDFKTCAINKCYQSDSDTSKCTPELKMSCLL